MASGWRYRVLSVLGVVTLVVGAMAAANQPLVTAVFELSPVVGTLPIDRAVGVEFLLEATVATLVVLVALVPLYKPQPRRILDIWTLAVKRTLVALLALATVGYFDYTYRIPRSTLLVVGGLLLVAVPLWFVAIRRRPQVGEETTIVVGDDPETMQRVYAALDGPISGYVAPPSVTIADESTRRTMEVTDGGDAPPLAACPSLGGLSRLDEVIVEHGVDTAVLAFGHPDRGEFFGALATCYEYGVTARVHRDHADVVLTPTITSGDLVDITLEPWDPQDHLFKRLFDVVFSATALVVLSPLVAVIALAIRVDDGAPVLYSQERTAALGETFTVYKFRTMTTGGEDTAPSEDVTNSRITRLGGPLRRTHLDEIPQLWSILTGKMSVVGPRAAWAHEERHLEATADNWRKRWFVKPGLTGLAQINDVSSTDPKEKLRYDLEYINRQSFWFDLKIVVRQLWLVGLDVVALLRGSNDR
ncbi:sugar transferase [Halapricum sp. CBA1109]|uniref:sugar transferase n=1 Tax=Halapricum sp. CBA1109 TaxID=2668068 RepID=UPI0012FACABB|nr:sugar transferase [Halapricum sp. CBA1109]MUV89464.1 sugar transferase [Halapricum sp. CBA1109]